MEYFDIAQGSTAHQGLALIEEERPRGNLGAVGL